jgi:hypothetical protein
MSEPMNFSDEPLELSQSDFDDWAPAPEFAPPPPAATYSVYVSEIREEKEFDTQKGKRYSATIDLRIIGGEYDDRAITWQRLSNTEFERKQDGRRTSQLMDLIKSAGIPQAPRSNREYSVALHGLHDRGPAAPFKVQIDWRGFCTSCYEKALMAATGAGTPEEAKAAASGEDKGTASKGAVKAKNYRGFPSNPAGGKADTFVCPDCGEEVRAQVRIVRFTV